MFVFNSIQFKQSNDSKGSAKVQGQVFIQETAEAQSLKKIADTVAVISNALSYIFGKVEKLNALMVIIDRQTDRQSIPHHVSILPTTKLHFSSHFAALDIPGCWQ